MDKIYCGSATEKKFDNGGEILKVSLDFQALLNGFAEWGYLTKDGKKKMTLKISRRREVGKYGETHTVEIDTFKPTKQVEQAPIQVQTQKPEQPEFESDIPF